MNLVKHIVALVLLTLWVPLTSHELLEQAGFIHHSGHVAAVVAVPDSHDHGADPEGGHDAADGLCRIDWGGSPLKVLPTAVLVLPPWMTAGLDVLCRFTGASSEEATPPDWSLTPPPAGAMSWQFSFRAALPARAPSPGVLA